MATLVLKYNSKNILAQKTLDYILSLGVFKKIPTKVPTKIDTSLQEIKQGKIKKYTTVDDFFKNLS